MRVVVTGATGNVGTSVVEALGTDDRVSEIIGLARRRSDWAPPKTELRAADVSVDRLEPHFEGADAIVHLAWLFQPTHRPTVTWQANVIGSTRVFEAAATASVPTIVHASSVGAYSPRPGDDRPVDESWPTHSLPTAAYGREKAYVERVLDAFEAAHPQTRVVRLRPAFIFKRSSATGQRRLFAGPFLPSWLARPGRLPVVPHPPKLRFQALHSADAADAYLRAVVQDVRGPFNVAAEPVLRGEDLARILGGASGRTVTVPRRALRAAVAAAWHAHLVPADPALVDLFLDLPLMDAGRARSVLGWEPRHSASEALAEMLAGLADGAGGPAPPLAPDDAAHRVQEIATGVGEQP